MRTPSPVDSYWIPYDEKANQRFWDSFGGKPPFQGAMVLDVGCGRGTLCIDLALSGVRKIIGVDIDPACIDFAHTNLRCNYPHFTDCVSFELGDLSRYADDTFDYIVSKDSFEHIMNLGELLLEMKRCLKPGGKIYAGYGPLYNSPDGPHGHYGILPWGHVFLPERLLVAMVNRGRDEKVNHLSDLNLVNHMSFAEHRSLIFAAGFKVLYFEVNRGKHLLAPFFSALRKISFLEEYFTYNIYCVLEKESE